MGGEPTAATNDLEKNGRDHKGVPEALVIDLTKDKSHHNEQSTAESNDEDMKEASDDDSTHQDELSHATSTPSTTISLTTALASPSKKAKLTPDDDQYKSSDSSAGYSEC